MDNPRKNIDKAVTQLLAHEPFYGFMALKVKYVECKASKEKPSSMAIGILNNRVTILYTKYDAAGHRTEVKKGQKLSLLAADLKHELEHLGRGHLFPAPGASKEDLKNQRMFAKLTNIAQDIELNQNIAEFLDSEEWVVEGEKVKLEYATLNNLRRTIPKAEALKPYSYYLRLLVDKAKEDHEKNKGSLKSFLSSLGFGTRDDHSGFGSSERPDPITGAIISQFLKEASAKAGGASNTPSPFLNYMAQLAKQTMNWKRELRRFNSNIQSINRRSTRSRRNRRYGFSMPGAKRDVSCNLLLARDTSGSMWEPSVLNKIQTEIKHLVESGTKVTVIDVDSQITGEYVFDGSFDATKLTGGGGTCFKPAFDRLKDKKDEFSGIVYFTDGGCSDTAELVDPGLPVLWVLTKGGVSPVKWGKTVELDEDVS